ncbi:MAG TPA: Holliday junction branch migration protein RuvA [Candidatus Colwellbacteria bacterium]|nr:Holliday junction branch migration protein RuvA [Candidatus Colwellbacteria bacterium]HQA96052.1 Holliday junction branch migration protein RuvA [Candidatus Colwellbacteria bacterium]
MIYSLKGKLEGKGSGYVIVETSGVGYKVFFPASSENKLPGIGKEIKLYTELRIKKDEGFDLYGFLYKEERDFFELLNTVSGIGPKTALGILNLASVGDLKAAIADGNKDILVKSIGIGKKTGERLITELKDKIFIPESGKKSAAWDEDVYQALLELGYKSKDAKEAVVKINPNLKTSAERLKEALKKVK